MLTSKMSPYELGESNNVLAIPYLIEYLIKGKENEKRLAASAISKLGSEFPQECVKAIPYLIHNLSSEQAQVRQYSLKAINSLPAQSLSVSDKEFDIISSIVMSDEKEYNQAEAARILVKWAGSNVLKENGVQTPADIKGEEPSASAVHYPVGATRKVIEKAKVTGTKTTETLVADGENDTYYFRDLEKMGVKLNEPQLQATRHFEGPALVLAGAGSGKTRVLSSRAGYLISFHHVNPQNILLLTFTKKAAVEMQERIALLPGLTKRIVEGVTCGTYHSIFLRLLKRYGDNRRIINSEKQKHISLKYIMKEMGLKDDYEPESLLAVLSNFKNNMVTVEEMLAKSPIEKEVKEILTRYEFKKKQNNYMDFDDMLLDSYLLLKNNPEILKDLQKQYSFVLCDEWQDTNPIQYELIKMIASPHNNLFVVGDDDQTVYEFNGADSSIILNFGKEYPGTKVYTLDINYRSTPTIVGLANKVISQNKKRYNKTLQVAKDEGPAPYFLRPQDSNEEAESVVKNIIHDVKRGIRRYKEFAVLFRTNSNSRAVFDQLVMNNVPFVTFGDQNTFYENATVKPVIDHLRLALNPNDMEAIKGVLPSLYLNREKTVDFIMNRELVSPQRELMVHLMELPYLKEYQKKQIFQRVQLLRKLNKLQPVQAVKKVREFYEKYLDADERKNLTMHKELIKETLSEIEVSAKQSNTIESYVGFVEDVIQKNKEMEELRKDPNADVVKLMTIHKSKGLEFPVVYLIGASENILPHSSSLQADDRKDILIKDQQKVAAAIEGECRLAYVAITRAETELYVSSPRLYGDKMVDVSRFFMEVFTDHTPPPPKEKKPKQIRKKQSRSVEKQTTGKDKHTILVWECMESSCNAWKRITNYNETLLETISCPVCKEGLMKQGARDL